MPRAWYPPGRARRPGRRRRKVYGITGLGAKMFEDLLRGAAGGGEDERSFHLRLAFARYLSPESRLGLFEQRRAVLSERLAHLASRARAHRDDGYVKALSERQREVLSGDVSWLDQLIAEERAGAAGQRPELLRTGPPAVPFAHSGEVRAFGQRLPAPAALRWCRRRLGPGTEPAHHQQRTERIWQGSDWR